MTDYFLGVEWLNTQVTIACLKKVGKKYQLFRLDRLPIPANNLIKTSEILRQWVKESLPDKNRVKAVLTLPESLIFLKALELPQAKEKELNEAISWEIATAASGLPAGAVIRWLKIAEEEKLVQVAVMAVKEELADQFLTIFDDAGIELLAIEPASLSFSRVAQAKIEETVLLVNSEKEETNLVILNQGVPIFSSSASVFLQGKRKQKRKLRPSVRLQLVSLAKKIVAFWQVNKKKEIKQVIITGEGIRYSGLAKAVNQFAQVPTLFGRVKSFKHILVSHQPKSVFSYFLIPFGAAVRLTLPAGERKVNFLPEKERKRLEKEEKAAGILKRISLFNEINFTVLAFSLLLLFAFKLWSHSYTKQVAQIQNFVNNHPAQKMIPQVLSANKLLDQVGQLAASQKDIGQTLQKIAELVPLNLRLTSLKLSSFPNEQWEIEGVADRNIILAFYEKLKMDSGAAEVIMPYSSLQKEKEASFRILLKW